MKRNNILYGVIEDVFVDSISERWPLWKVYKLGFMHLGARFLVDSFACFVSFILVCFFFLET